MVTSTPLVAAATTKVLSGTTSLIHWLLACAEAPALEEALRNAGFGSETKTMQNPAFDEHTSDEQGKHGAKSALGALQIHVRPRRSSFKVLSSAGKDVQHSIFVSAKKTAGLTVGLVSHNNKICVSCSSIVMWHGCVACVSISLKCLPIATLVLKHCRIATGDVHLLQGSNKYLRAMSIFAMPMIPFGEPDTPQHPRQEAGRNDRIGVDVVYNKVSRLLSVDNAPEMFDRVLEPRPATRLPLGPRHINK